jgi:hypothetical protein
MTEKRDKVTTEDIIGLIKTDERTDSVEEVRKLRGRSDVERFTVKVKNSRWVRRTYYVIMDCGKEEILGLTNKREAHDVCCYLNIMNDRLENVLAELYEKDRRIEELGGDIGYDGDLNE